MSKNCLGRSLAQQKTDQCQPKEHHVERVWNKRKCSLQILLMRYAQDYICSFSIMPTTCFYSFYSTRSSSNASLASILASYQWNTSLAELMPRSFNLIWTRQPDQIHDKDEKRVRKCEAASPASFKVVLRNVPLLGAWSTVRPLNALLLVHEKTQHPRRIKGVYSRVRKADSIQSSLFP